ncbi:Glycosyltransferase 9 family protein [Pararobbsia alpina]|uniref:tetratricopeptide repeat protein n=1 Tax=Pararobbsia alpina TaxID=621374 RepID=UPI0039A6AA64
MRASQPETQTGLFGGQPVVNTAIASALKAARVHLERGEAVEAQKLYRGVLAFDPGHAEALHFLGLACDRAGDVAQAEPLLAKSLQRGLRYAWTYTNHATVLVKLGRYDKAIGVVEQALSIDARYAPAHVCRGNALLEQKQPAAAQAAYESALALHVGIAEAWRQRGKALFALKRPADAVISFDRALVIAPQDFDSIVGRGDALRDLGQYENALRAYQLALVIRPHDPALLSAAGTMWLQLGEYAQGLACFEEVLAAQPDNHQALYASCVALDHLHRYDLLLERSNKLLAADGTHAVSWLALGNALQGLRRYDEAADAFERAVAYDANLHIALANRGIALRLGDRCEEALERFDEAIARGEAHPQLLCSRAHALQQLGRFDESLESYLAAATLAPVDVAGWFGRGLALQQLQRYEEAIECYEQIRKLGSAERNTQQDEAFCRLIIGDFENGWPQYESRWLDADAARHRRHMHRPQWTGKEPIGGKTVLLHSEQGYGDTLQFCRYARVLAARGASVILEVPAALKRLLGTLDGVKLLVAAGDPLPEFDYQCALLSVPLALKTTIESVPSGVPYLRADSARVEKWRARIEASAPAKRLRVGVAWSGNATHNNDINRSIPLATLAPLFEKDITLVSLHQEVRERDRAALSASPLVHFGSDLQDYSDTAGLIEALDLVIAVDTSVVHLAGALNRPVWILLPRAPDWRWLTDRDDSPWYPSVTLFRQTRPGDWAGVVERLAQSLDEFASQTRR